MTIRSLIINAVLSLILVAGLPGIVSAETSTGNLLYTANDDSTQVYDTVDEMPEVVGGLAELYKNIEYPAAAIANNVEGSVFIQFIVDETGNVSNPKVLKEIGSGCGDAAIAALSKVQFTPGKLDGKAVKVNFTIPVKFQIK